MNLRCKVGDLAVVVNSEAGNDGKIVTVIKFAGFIPEWVGDDRWVIDVELKNKFGTPREKHIRDSQLRPIRDQDGQDETLTWADVPSVVTA